MEATEPVKSAPAHATPARGQTNTGKEAGAQGVRQLGQGHAASQWHDQVPEEGPRINMMEGTKVSWF